MATYEIQTDDGSVYQIDTEDVQSQPVPEKGLISKSWDALAVPAQKSKEGLKMIAGMLPESGEGIAQTTSPTVNAILGTPRVAVDTLADTAPGFISRGAIATAGALKGAQMASPVIAPIAKSVGKFAGEGLEKISGLTYKTPGVLAEAFKDPSLIFAKGKEVAAKAYKVLKGGEGEIRPELSNLAEKKAYVKKAVSLLNEGGLTADEALQARQVLDDIKDQITPVFFNNFRKIFDATAKTKYAAADMGYAKGVKADALRTILPINKTGTPSIVKGGVMGIAPFLAPVMSPVTQGIAASTLGAASKFIPPILRNPLGSGQAIDITRKYFNRQKQ
jgi:hypothetical protein